MNIGFQLIHFLIISDPGGPGGIAEAIFTLDLFVLSLVFDPSSCWYVPKVSSYILYTHVSSYILYTHVSSYILYMHVSSYILYTHVSSYILYMHVKVLVVQSCLTLCDPMGCSLPNSSVHGILQARILEWIAISSSRGSSRPRDQSWVYHIAGRFFIVWATREAHICYMHHN